MKSFKIFFVCVQGGARWMQHFQKMIQVPKTTQSLWCAFPIATWDWYYQVNVHDHACVCARNCARQNIAVGLEVSPRGCSSGDVGRSGTAAPRRGCLTHSCVVGCVSFWHKHLRSKSLENDIKNQLRYIIIKRILLFRGLNEYNEPAQALMNKN